ncbi:DUF2721 domain-containing protein [Alteromonas sp. CYL-A6]|uniref:DUF2721 domain-containing protein n=1 Tax=Alteromonas nitratireducens TaxID=3390813 RepID=UPI0034AF0757
MKIDIATPAMLFPAISLLLLAYTNRFLTLATVIRNFTKDDDDENSRAQIKNLHKRVELIKRMQIAGVGSFLFCTLSMLTIYMTYQELGNGLFGLALLFLLYSLWMSVRELLISSEALDFHLKSIQKEKPGHANRRRF